MYFKFNAVYLQTNIRVMKGTKFIVYLKYVMFPFRCDRFNVGILRNQLLSSDLSLYFVIPH